MRLGPVGLFSRAAIIAVTFINPQRTAQAQDNKNQPAQAAQNTHSVGVPKDNLYEPVFSLKDSKVSKLMGSYVFNEPPNARWEITETYRYDGDKELTVYPSDIEVEYEGQSLSNSRVASHAIPKNHKTKFKLNESNSAETTLIESSNDEQKCKERVTVQILKFNRQQSAINETGSETPPAFDGGFINPVYSPLQQGEPLILKKGDQFQVRYIYEHDHFVYGKYDPLFGTRNITLTVGPHKIYSSHNLNTDLSPMNPTIQLSITPEERLFNTEYYRGTDRETISRRKGKFLYLTTNVSGYQYFRFDNMSIRAGDKFKLSFDYCIASGSEGDCHVRVMEFQDTPDAWYRLDGGFDEQLPKQGNWQKYEQTFKTLNETTTMALDFRILYGNTGEMWIDKLQLENLSAERVPTRRFYRPSPPSLTTNTEEISITKPDQKARQSSSLTKNR